jgi:hypothetical protein
VNDLIFEALLILLMFDDPSNLPDWMQLEIVVQVNDEARARGFNDWVDAYHKVGK